MVSSHSYVEKLIEAYRKYQIVVRLEKSNGGKMILDFCIRPLELRSPFDAMKLDMSMYAFPKTTVKTKE
jgi:hypothetical protein